MTDHAQRILVCDHRGQGIEARLREISAADFELRTARSLRESIERLGSWRPQLLILDPLTKNAVAEISALTRGEAGPLRENIPVLVILDRDPARDPGEWSKELGPRPWDMIDRNASPEELGIRLRQLLGYGRMLMEMGRLRHRAAHDDRTDLLRPQAFQTRMNEHFAAAKRHQLELCFVMMDLDKFGQINKRHDHTIGDKLIAKVGEVIRRSLRTEDVAGRLGGDEFAVLLPYTKRDDALQVVGRLRERIANLSGPFEGADEDIPVSTSIGFETFDGEDLESVESLRKNAEKALRKAKRSGGDQAIYYRELDPGN